MWTNVSTFVLFISATTAKILQSSTCFLHDVFFFHVHMKHRSMFEKQIGYSVEFGELLNKSVTLKRRLLMYGGEKHLM